MKRLPALLLLSTLTGGLTQAQTASDIKSDVVSKTRGNAIEDAPRVEPLNYQAHMADAARQYAANNYAMAFAGYHRVLASYPDDLTALSGEAWSLYHLGQEEKAASEFQTLLRINSRDSWAQKGLALCRQQTAA